jgi:hypothetical protein
MDTRQRDYRSRASSLYCFWDRVNPFATGVRDFPLTKWSVKHLACIINICDSRSVASIVSGLPQIDILHPSCHDAMINDSLTLPSRQTTRNNIGATRVRMSWGKFDTPRGHDNSFWRESDFSQSWINLIEDLTVHSSSSNKNRRK